jgi:hypothetical protein
MVIVDVRASGGRGDTGIPTDAYFPVEEIRDVSWTSPIELMRKLTTGRNGHATYIHARPHLDRG